jgi:hypothetical protein
VPNRPCCVRRGCREVAGRAVLSQNYFCNRVGIGEIQLLPRPRELGKDRQLVLISPPYIRKRSPLMRGIPSQLVVVAPAVLT